MKLYWCALSDDGTFNITKAPNTGGKIAFGPVAEQLTYEERFVHPRSLKFHYPAFNFEVKEEILNIPKLEKKTMITPTEPPMTNVFSVRYIK